MRLTFTLVGSALAALVAAPALAHDHSSAPSADETYEPAEPYHPSHEAGMPTTSGPMSGFAQNALWLELGGNAGFYSLNYERYLSDDAAVRVGGMFFSVSVSSGDSSSSGLWAAFPVTFSYLGLGAGSHALELGGGLVPMYGEVGVRSEGESADASAVIVAATGIAGYRFAPKRGGFVFRASVTPLLFVGGGGSAFLPWGGLSLGYRF